MLKKLSILVLSILVSLNLCAQIQEAELFGTWKGKQVIIDPSQMPQKLPPEIKLFEKELASSTFTFNPDHKCTVIINKELSVSKAYWKYDTTTAALDIIEWEDRNIRKPALLFRLYAMQKGEYFAFMMDETPYTLIVVKQQQTPK